MRQSTVIKGIIIVVLAGIITFVIHSLASSIAHLFSKENMIKLLEFVGVSLLIIIVLWLIWLLLVWLYKKTFPTPHTTTTATPPPPPATPAATVTTTVAAAPAAGATPAGGATATTTVVTPPAPHPPPAPAVPHGGTDHAHVDKKNLKSTIWEVFWVIVCAIAIVVFVCGMFYWIWWPKPINYRTDGPATFNIEKNDMHYAVAVTKKTRVTLPDGRVVLAYPNGGAFKLIKKSPNLPSTAKQDYFGNTGRGSYKLEVAPEEGDVASKAYIATGTFSVMILKFFYYD